MDSRKERRALRIPTEQVSEFSWARPFRGKDVRLQATPKRAASGDAGVPGTARGPSLLGTHTG